ncbi:SDR family oxidoreductase [Streptomyces sp. NPDC017966]|uniref:SDR family oxidoreductase n=1 Tax=Streptomyces sp. NPDC017966 TaxID=3365023 RepID=UPI0037AFF073
MHDRAGTVLKSQQHGELMKVVVAGGTGLIRRQAVGMLRSSGRDAVSAAPLTGVGTLTEQGMKQVLKGADVVVDAFNSPSFQAKTSLDFFTRSAQNLIAAAQRAGVRRYVMLSVIGADQLPENGYFRAKSAQEGVLRDSELPYTIVRAARFFEFIAPVMGLSTREGRVHLPSTQLRPVAAADVAAAVATSVEEEPLYGVRQIAGPETHRLNRLGELTPAVQPDGRRVVTDENAGLFAGIPDGVLTGGTTVSTALTCYEDRLKQNSRKSMIRAGAL